MILDIKKRAMRRAKILEGQMRGLQKMIDQDEYCIDILTQSLAIQKSLGSFNKLVLEGQLRKQLSGQNMTSEDYDGLVKELLDLYELTSVRSK